MTEKTGQKHATATSAVEAKEETQETEAFTGLRLSSEVIIFDTRGIFQRIEDDGEFVLQITAGVVTGRHSFPAPHDVLGSLVETGTPNIILNSVGGERVHTGIRRVIGGVERYIGLRIPLSGGRSFEQEEGVWVGTKVG